jgi:Family of unknown function (DUF5994)
MTSHLQIAAPTSDESAADPAVRLELKPTIPTSAWVDGVWWPRTRDLTAELPPLLTAVSHRVGTVAMVGYHLNAWNHAGRQVDTDSGTVILQGFTADDPPTVLVIGTSGQRLTLVVVPSGTGDATASKEFDEVSGSTLAPYAPESHADVALDQSLADVATRLGNIDGRTDERTANIARWVQEAALQFIDAPVQAFVPILVEHIVRQKLNPMALRSAAQRRLIDHPDHSLTELKGTS